MDIGFIKEFIPSYLYGGLITLELSILGIAFSLIIGFLCALSFYFSRPFFSKVASLYIELARNTPLLIQLFFLYYGLPKLGVQISAFTCAVISLGFLGGGYMAESFRLGFESIKHSQYEAGVSLGLTKSQTLRYVIMPQAFRISLPSITANVVFLIKETSVVSVVALADLVYVTKDIIGLYYRTDEALILLVVSYLIIILPISFGLDLLERKLRYVRS